MSKKGGVHFLRGGHRLSESSFQLLIKYQYKDEIKKDKDNKI